MTTLQYYSAKGKLTVFDDYMIEKNGIVTNILTGHVMSQCENASGYNRTTIRHEEQPYTILTGRALASTFLGPPPTNRHTADHKDKNNSNDVLSNIRWLCKSGQRKNQTRPTEYKSAFLIVKDGVELTVKDWVKMYKKPNGKEYTIERIQQFAQQQLNGFRYKVFPKLHGEVWKAVSGSKNKMGEWFISNKNRIKYKTKYAENVMTVEQLTHLDGYPQIKINGKIIRCHYLSMMTFRPREYAAKLPGDIIMHKNDDKLNFNPFRLRWGTPPENGKDAHRNGKYDGTKKKQKPVASYINDVFEKNHESLRDAAKYLRENGYPTATRSNVTDGLYDGVVRYDRTWKSV
ncbi:hypothetical protein ATCVCanal1_258L [Acanthocystis turfacea Chlorella virus Canal-1]|nr:hypothetical protein ATCVCanal1_258L [Acanthocystis turfacea Chlorella virus Canal-1]